MDSKKKSKPSSRNKLSIDWEEIMKYPGEWVNYYDKKIISHNTSLKKANADAFKILKHKKYIGLYVKPEWGKVICL